MNEPIDQEQMRLFLWNLIERTALGKHLGEIHTIYEATFTWARTLKEAKYPLRWLRYITVTRVGKKPYIACPPRTIEHLLPPPTNTLWTLPSPGSYYEVTSMTLRRVVE